MLIKTAEEIKKIERAGQILAEVMKKIAPHIKEGAIVKSLDEMAESMIRQLGGEPAFLGYHPYGAVKPYPCTICASVNEVVVHGVPVNRVLKSGDIVKIDMGVKYEGYHADAAVTVGVGDISKESRKLIEVTRKALERGIKAAKPNNTLGDIGHAIQFFVEKNGFKVVRGLTGHGVGAELHEDPPVFNEGKRGGGMKLKPGMVLALEPMVSAGSPNIVQLQDDSYATEDGSLSAHFEHTIVITERGARVLTML